MDDSTEKTLIANERSLYEAVAEADKVSFHLRQWSIDNPRVTWSNENSALLLYARTGGGTLDGHPLAATTLASTLWAKRGDKWLAVHHQETDLAQQ